MNRTADREGFERLVADVGMGRVGIVMGLEVSRLAHSRSARYRLLEICAVTVTNAVTRLVRPPGGWVLPEIAGHSRAPGTKALFCNHAIDV